MFLLFVDSEDPSKSTDIIIIIKPPLYKKFADNPASSSFFNVTMDRSIAFVIFCGSQAKP